ncbi:MAG: hypothetical protein M3Q10_10960, partial [Chloroflexota bacterium]|nr:hypothetical protein [Chloroflexota bacterium]
MSDYLRAQEEGLVRAVQTEDDNFLLQVNEGDFVAHLVDRFRVPVLRLKFDEAYATESRRSIPAEEFPSGFSVRHGRSYEKPVFTVRIPYEGDVDLLCKQPSTYLSWNAIVHTEGQEVCFEVVDFYGAPERINQAVDEQINNLRQSSEYLVWDVEAFNRSLPARAERSLRERKD